MKLVKSEGETLLVSSWLELGRVFREDRKTLQSFLQRSQLATLDGHNVVFAPQQFLAVAYHRLLRRALGIRGRGPTDVAQQIFVLLTREPSAALWIYATQASELAQRDGTLAKTTITRVRLAPRKSDIHTNPQETLVWTRPVQPDYQELLRELTEVSDRGLRDQYRPKERRPIEEKIRSTVQGLRAAVAVQA